MTVERINRNAIDQIPVFRLTNQIMWPEIVGLILNLTNIIIKRAMKIWPLNLTLYWILLGLTDRLYAVLVNRLGSSAKIKSFSISSVPNEFQCAIHIGTCVYSISIIVHHFSIQVQTYSIRIFAKSINLISSIFESTWPGHSCELKLRVQ